MYVTIAEYDDSYLHYLQNKKPLEEAGFLTMNRFGPIMTNASSNMATLAAILKRLLPYAAAHPPTHKSPAPSPARGRSAEQPPVSVPGSREQSALGAITKGVQAMTVTGDPSEERARSSGTPPALDARESSRVLPIQSASHPSGTPADQPANPQVGQSGGQHGGQADAAQRGHSDGGRGGPGRGQGPARGRSRGGSRGGNRGGSRGGNRGGSRGGRGQ